MSNILNLSDYELAIENNQNRINAVAGCIQSYDSIKRCRASSDVKANGSLSEIFDNATDIEDEYKKLAYSYLIEYFKELQKLNRILDEAKKIFKIKLLKIENENMGVENLDRARAIDHMETVIGKVREVQSCVSILSRQFLDAIDQFVEDPFLKAHIDNLKLQKNKNINVDEDSDLGRLEILGNEILTSLMESLNNLSSLDIDILDIEIEYMKRVANIPPKNTNMKLNFLKNILSRSEYLIESSREFLDISAMKNGFEYYDAVYGEAVSYTHN